MNTSKFEKTIDTIQTSLVWFVIMIITICIGILFLFDVLAGTGTMLFLTSGKTWQSVVISLSTTGLLFSLMFIGYMLYENRQTFIKQIGGFILLVAGAIYIEDIVFDALLADILRYGTISLGQVDAIQWMFRFLLGGISTVGDALAIAMVIGLPVLKTIIGKAVQDPQVHNQPTRTQTRDIPKGYSRPIPETLPRARDGKAHIRPVKQNFPEPAYHPFSLSNYKNPLDEQDIPEFLKKNHRR